MHIQGRWSSGRAGGAEGKLKNNKIVTNYVCFCSSTMLTAKITEIVEIHSEFSECPNSCINLFQVDLDKLWNYLWYRKSSTGGLYVCTGGLYVRAGGAWH